MSGGTRIPVNLRTLAQILALTGISVMGASAFRPILNVPVSDLLFFGVFLLMIGQLSRHVSLHPFVMLGAGLVTTGGLLSSFYAVSPSDSVLQLTKFVFVFLVLLLFIPNLFVTRRQFNWLCWAALLSGVINGVAAIFEYQTGQRIFSNVEGLTWRMVGLTVHANELGDHCALMILVGLWLYVGTKRISQKVIALILMTISLVGVALSVSIGAAVAASVGVVIYVLLQRSLHLVLIIGLMGLIIGFSYNNFFQAKETSAQSLAERLSIYGDSTQLEDTTLGSRIKTYRVALASIEQNPLVGAGNDDASAITSTGDQVHNIFLLAWYQTGILGMFGIVLIIFVPLTHLWRHYRAADRTQRLVVSCMIALWVGCVLIDCEGPVFFQRINWLPFSIITTFLLNSRRWQVKMPAPQPMQARPALIRGAA